MRPEEVGVEVVEEGDMVGLSLSVAISHLIFSVNLRIDFYIFLYIFFKEKICLICHNV